MDFRTQVAEEKKRLSQQRRDVQKRMSALESELGALGAEMKNIDGEMAAIEAYETAQGSAPALKRRQPRKAAAGAKTGSGTKKATRRRRRVSRRGEILAAIASFGSAGAGRADIIQTLNVKGDKSAEQSVSNALAALKKSGDVAHEDGKYIAGAASAGAPADAPGGDPGGASAGAPADAPGGAPAGAPAGESPAPAAAEESPAPESATTAPQARRRRTSRRTAIVSIIEAAGSEGVGRSAIIEQLGVKGDKSAEQSVSNALANLKKSGGVAHNDGKYSSAS